MRLAGLANPAAAGGLGRDRRGGAGGRHAAAHALVALEVARRSAVPPSIAAGRRLLGWPLVHLLWSDPALPKAERRQARGWVAIGDAPVGFLAIGGMARGVIAFGGLSLGVFSIGGVGLGLVSLGGCVVGVWSYGGTAAGWIVNAGLALGWHFALGAVAAAHEAALGNIVTAHPCE